MGDKQVVNHLITLLKEANSDVRTAAVQALERLDERLGKYIHGTLAGSQEALKKLVQLNDPRSVPSLIQALHDQDSSVRSAAAYTLGEMNSAQAVNPLITMASGWSPRERFIAVRALMKIDQGGIDYLLTVLKMLGSLASLVYLMCVALIVFAAYQGTRRGVRSICRIMGKTTDEQQSQFPD